MEQKTEQGLQKFVSLTTKLQEQKHFQTNATQNPPTLPCNSQFVCLENFQSSCKGRKK